jgi:death-on-curing protein
MKIITSEQVKIFHNKIIQASGGSLGIRDEKLIDSALNRGISTFDGSDLYKTDFEKISAITHSLITNHAFVDGNKRIGIAVMLLLLKLNEISISYSQEELIDLGLGIANGSIAFDEIINWLLHHIA